MTSKVRTAHQLLARSPNVWLHCDTRVSDGLIVPNKIRHKAHVVLQVGLNMPVPIPDLTFDDDGFSGTLSFRGKPFRCVVPWAAIKAMVCEDDKGVIFDQSWFDEMSGSIADKGLTGAPVPTPEPRAVHPSERPYLRRVK